MGIIDGIDKGPTSTHAGGIRAPAAALVLVAAIIVITFLIAVVVVFTPFRFFQPPLAIQVSAASAAIAVEWMN
jgi:hypothetical protein